MLNSEKCKSKHESVLRWHQIVVHEAQILNPTFIFCFNVFVSFVYFVVKGLKQK